MSVNMLKATPRCARNRCRDETTWKSKPGSFKNIRLNIRTYKCTHTHSNLHTYVYTPQAHNINTHTTYMHTYAYAHEELIGARGPEIKQGNFFYIPGLLT